MPGGGVLHRLLQGMDAGHADPGRVLRGRPLQRIQHQSAGSGAQFRRHPLRRHQRNILRKQLGGSSGSSRFNRRTCNSPLQSLKILIKEYEFKKK